MELKKVDNKIILTYDYSYSNVNFDWVKKKLERDGYVSFKKTFHFNILDVFKPFDKEYDEELELIDFEIPPISFVFAKKDGEYFKIEKRKLNTKKNVHFSEDIDFSIDFFVAKTNISIFNKIDKLVNEDIFIGGKKSNAIPFNDFLFLIKKFPNDYEKNLYSEARISSIIKNYFETTFDAEVKFQNYLNKKVSTKGTNLNKIFQEYELQKFKAIHEKLEFMLSSENSYSEHQWQNEILEIILLLYPKYILSFKSVPIKIDSGHKRFLDFMLIDNNGHVDVIEIKKPFQNSIMTHDLYRNNYIPHKELTGTVMQLEKYLYYLNREGKNREKNLSEKYRNDLPKDLNIKITNPQGFIIMGRENNLSPEQKSDFEVVKRKYKNVIDIITYDELLQRLKFTIELIKIK